MTQDDKRLLRLAIAIHEQLILKHEAPTSLEIPTETWRRSEALLRRLKKAQGRGWRLAAERLRRDLRTTLQRLGGDLTGLGALLEQPSAAAQRGSIRDIYADLVALREEFDDISFDLPQRTLSVTTEAIELERIYLGPFEIRLDWSDLAHGHPRNYRVIALDAHPAENNESVTHPHIMDEGVCEGEGRQPIRNALAQGRLLDFFVIVANLLRTYNAGSPYVSLSEWNGAECSDCGGTIYDDERWTCQKCETTICEACYCNCAMCDGVFCCECVTRCEGCETFHCRACLIPCSCCDTEVCRGCLDDQERCSNCHDQQTTEPTIQDAGEEVDEDTEQRVAVTARAGHGEADLAVHADGLGQTAVPA